MPRHDPVPPKRLPEPEPERLPEPVPADRPAADRNAFRDRLKQMLLWVLVAAVTAVLLALIWLKSFGDPVPLHMQIATILGVGFSVLVGGGLMSLVFLSNRSGHDDGATFGERDDERD